jgi:MGT family glycosyltransferase
MSHFGIISPPVPGHIHPMSALGRELIARGHRVTYLQMLDLEEKIASEDIEFEPLGQSDHPRGSLPVSLARLGQLQGLQAIRFTIDAVARTTEMVCRDAPAAIRRKGIDALIVDQMEPAGGSVAEHLGLPFVTICNALAINRDPAVPPAFSPWGPGRSLLARVRNGVGYTVSDWMTRPVARVVAEYRHRWRLPRLESPEDSFSRLAQICQMPRQFDFPRTNLPPTFHYVGPLRRRRARQIEFPWDRLDGRPLVYASLGTLQNSREPVFRCFAEACKGLDVQLVISHGGGLTKDQASQLPGAPLVVSYAPQEELLARTRVTLTHAGLNTVLDSLTHGVPLVAVPITYEQPAIARRVEWCGAGETIPFASLHPSRVRTAITAVLQATTYRRSAAEIGNAIARDGGVKIATSLIERAVNQYTATT